MKKRGSMVLGTGAHVRRRNYFPLIITAIFVFGFVASLISTLTTSAAANIFKIQNVEQTGISASAEGTITGFDEQTISSGVVFHRLNDYVEYTITLKNTDTSAHIIETITDDNSNPYIIYDYLNHQNEQINAGNDLVFVVTARYVNQADMNDRVSVNNVKFNIKFLDIEEDDEVIVVPDTGANTSTSGGVSFSTISLIISALGLILICVLVMKKQKKASRVIVALIICISTITFAATVKAEEASTNGFTLTTGFAFKDRLIVTYKDANNSEHQEVINYGSLLNLENPEKNGYRFAGWKYADGSVFIASDPITDDISIVPVFTLDTYNISYDLAGGTTSEPNTTTYTVNDIVTLNEPTKAYYNFAGWTGTDLTEPTKNVVIPAGCTGDRSYTATYTPIDYDITYSNITSEELASLSVPSTYNIETASFIIGKPATRVDGDGDPTYTFVGWKEGSTISETIALPDVNSMGPKTFEAQWAPVDATTYTISYELNGGTTATPNRTTFTKNDETFSIINPTKTGHTFKGWSGTDLTGDTNTNVQVVQGTRKSLSFEAHYTANTYKVIFDANNGSGSMADQTLTYDTAANLTTNIYTRFGYSFNGWNTEAGGTGTSYTDGASVINLRTEGEITLYAQWTANSYLVAFDCNHVGCEGTIGNLPMVYDVEKALPLNAFSVPGYTFAGWNTKPTGDGDNYGNGATVNNLTAVGTITLYAKWTATPQSITYILDGGTANNPATYTIEESVTLNNPTREGYNFTGWSGTGLEGEENMEVVIPVGSIGERVYTAHWAAISYDITYTGLDKLTEEELESISNPTSYTVENTFTLDAPMHAGYTFTGWTSSNSDTPQMVVVVEAGTTGTLNFEAHFTPNTYYVHFEKNPGPNHTVGGLMEEQYFTYDESQALTPSDFRILVEQGFKFGGWNTEPDGSGIHYDDGEVVKNLTTEPNKMVLLYAEWGRTPYSIAFDKNNDNAQGEMLPIENITFGEHVTLPACGFVYDDHKLASWNTEPDGSGRSYGDQADVVNVAVDGTITLYAQWRDTEAIFGLGADVNTVMKNLAGGNLANITSVLRYVGEPNISSFTDANIISASNSPDKIYAWMDNGTLYYWSEDNIPAMNNNARGMFSNLSNATTIEVSDIDTSNTSDMAWLFSGDRSLQNIDLSGFNTENTTNMQSMFQNCESLTSLDVSSFNTENVTTISSMFEGCSGLESLDITNFKTSGISSFANLFKSCSKLSHIDVSKMDVSKATSMDSMFSKSGVTTVDMSSWNAPLLENISHMFASCPKLETIDVSMLGLGNLKQMDYMFEVTPMLASITFGDNFDVSKVKNMSGIFFKTTALKILDISSFNTASATSMNDLFRSSAVETVYASDNFNTTGVANTAALFGEATNIIGGMGTRYTGYHINKDYAHIDGGTSNPGYFTDKNTLNIFFDANGGTGTMASQVNLPANTDVTLNPNQFGRPREGYVFGGWNTEPDGSGTRYDNEGTINAYGRVVLYAQWGATPYTVIFDKNAPTGITVNGTMENISREYGERFNLPANQYSADGYALLGWNTKADGKGKHYSDEEEVVNLDIDGEVTLYAEWKEMTALFDTGANVHSTMVSLVTPDHTIRKIKESATAPDLNNVTYKLLSLKDSYYPIYGWYDEDMETAYYWTEAEEFHLNANSAAMFDSLVDVTEIDTTHFNTSRVTNMSAMFRNCPSLESLSIANWDTSKVTNMSQMFGRPDWGLKGDESLTVLDLSNWNTSAVTNMSNMFFGCKNLVEVKTDNWNTSAVTNMTSMFNGCSSLTTIDGATLSTDAATTFESMFAGCSSLSTINASGWNTGNVTKMNNMFAGCTSLSSLNIKNWNTEKVTTMANMFGGLSYNGEGCKSLTSLDLGGWKTGNVTNMSKMFQGCTGLTTLNLAGWNTEKVTDMSGMFGGDDFKKGCESLTSLDVTHFNTSAVTTMSNMFNDVKTLTTLDVTHFNTSSVKDMSGLFAGMTSLTSIDVSHFDTSNVTTMASMFRGTNSLTNLDITAFNTSNVKSINKIFNGAGITEIDLTHFDARKVTDVGWFVYEARNLETIYANENTDLSSANGYAPYFDTKLKGGANTGYSYSHLEADYGRIDDPDNGKPGYFTPKNSRYIRYNANGGEGAMTSHYVKVSTSSTDTLHSNAFTREGFEFVGWNTAADGSGDSYSDEQLMNGKESSKTPLTLYAQWDVAQPNNTVMYLPNGGTGTMGFQEIYNYDGIVLTSPNYTKENSGFAGWNTAADGSGTMYGPTDTVDYPENGKIKLYAQWKTSAGNMQGFSCSSLPLGQMTALTDTRDGQTYTVAKLDDGKCWMTENLRFDIETNGNKMNSTNTNNPDASFVSAVSQNPAPATTWCIEESSDCVDKITYNNENLKSLNTANSNRSYDNGVYYNWYTATAGNGTYSTAGRNVSGDICPAGWRLPTGYQTGDFGVLLGTIFGVDYSNTWSINNSTNPTGTVVVKKIRSYPYNFAYSGIANNDSIASVGQSIDLWGAYGDTFVFTRGFWATRDETSPGTGMRYKANGATVRCIAQ